MASILIAEDEPNILKLLALFLKSLNYTVHTAGNGREALDFYNQNPEKTDLVISDLLMPEMGGLELCRALQGRVPVVVASALADKENLEQVRAVGALDFIAKPYDLNVVKTKLAEIFQKLNK